MTFRSVLFIFLVSLSQVTSKSNQFASSGARVSSAQTLIYGPALNPRVTTPARYLYIQCKDDEGRNFTHSPGKSILDIGVIMTTLDGKVMKLQTMIGDRGDGTFLVRFFFNKPPEKITISIKIEGQNVQGSPFVVERPLVEFCNCPRPNVDAWKKDFQCLDKEAQLEIDLQPFREKGVEESDIVESLKDLDDGQNCFVHYAILNNRIYAKQYGPHGGFQKFVDEILLSLSRKVPLPDGEFIFNLGDWPLAKGKAKGRPIISWCGSNDTDDIIVPTYKQTLATVFGKDIEVVSDVDAQCYEAGGGWKSKIPKLFFRGRDVSAERIALMEIGKQYSHLIDAQISRNHMDYFPDEDAKKKHVEFEKKYGPKAKRTSFIDFWKYKYLMNVDGSVAAYRMPALLAGNSVVFKQDSPYYEHFYVELEPWKHYIPVHRNMSNTVEQVLWAKKNDKKAQQISTNGRLFARNRLRPEDIYCYYFTTLVEYSKLLKFKPQIRTGMKMVNHESTEQCTCPWKKKKKSKKESKLKKDTKDEL